VAALSLIGALPPDEVFELLRGRLRRLEDQRAEIRKLIDDALAAGVHPLFLVEEDYRLALLDADSAFTEQFIERIEHPTTGWRRQWASFYQEES
jgi:hypothetical protein